MSSLKQSDVKNHLSTHDRNGKSVLRLHKEPGTPGPLPADSGLASPGHSITETRLQLASAEALGAPIEGEIELRPFLVSAVPKSSQA
jgi:hypothetical protein